MLAINPKKLCVCHAEYRKGEWCQRWCARANDKSRDPEVKRYEYTDMRKPPNRELFGKVAHQIECLDTGEIYESAKILAALLDVSDSAVCNCCRGRSITLKGMQYRYLGDTKRQWIEAEVKPRAVYKHTKKSIPILDRSTGKVYASCTEVAAELGCCKSAVYKHLTRDYGDRVKRFEYVEEIK